MMKILDFEIQFKWRTEIVPTYYDIVLFFLSLEH